MNTRVVEVQAEGSGNWGAFHLWQFREPDIARRSEIHPESTVWGALRPPTLRDIVIWDLRTREGAMFDMTAELVPQLYRHQIHVCVLFEPFLAWLQAFLRSGRFDELPAVVTLPATAAPPTEILGWRHGDWLEKLPTEALRYLSSFERLALLGMVPPLPRSLALLIKKLLPNTSPQVQGTDAEAEILRGRGAERTLAGEQLRKLGGL